MIETGRHSSLITLAALLLVLVPATGCDRGNDARENPGDTAAALPSSSSGSEAEATPAGKTSPTGEERPETKSGTISLEGMPHDVRLQLIQEGLPFSTYIPENDFVLEQAASDEGTGVRFIAKFGGVLNRDASLSFFFPTEESSQAQMEELIGGSQGLGASNGWKTEKLSDASSYCPWAVSAYRIEEGEDIIGHACIGMHKGKAFYVIAAYPREYAEGFGPRASLILSEFRWNDTGTGLEKD